MGIFAAPVCLAAQTLPLSQSLATELKSALCMRMQARGIDVPADFPSIHYDPELAANARYACDTIWLGQIQPVFATREDYMSLIYHEYRHWCHEREGRYLVGTDSLGNILQWNTGEQYLHLPDSEEVNRDLAHFEEQVLPGYGEMSPSDRAAHLARFRRDMEAPRWLPFIYAPSHLAEAELAAYQAQLEGESLGLYVLSASARREMSIRIRQLEATLDRRRGYEERQGLGPDGRP
jgi:hypothetical protein